MQTAGVSVEQALPSRPHPLGVRARAGGVDVAVVAAHAEGAWFCVLEPGGRAGAWRERQVELTSRTHGVWHGFVPGVPVGARYGFRVAGRWEPVLGYRHNPAKFLLDPYARALDAPLTLRPEAFAHVVDERFEGDPFERDGRDSAPFVPHGVVTGRPFDWQGDEPPAVPLADTVIYEAHVRGLTRRLPGVPEPLRGTYAGLGHPAAVEHLLRLGVTTVELLPMHAIGDEPWLVARGRRNYWGYSTLAFFAPEPRYAAARDPLDALDEVKAMVRSLHAAGIEVVLDVVYNHTCEGGLGGPSLSWRGLDAATYYRLDPHGGYVDTTGCGNSLDYREPRVIQMTLDSLRYWVEEVHVDGFRFDLAPTLARGFDGFDREHPFLVAARVDPVLGGVKLIAEPWDVGPYGWRTGQFPPPFAEWNDRFRDGVRDFWLAGGRQVARGHLAGGVRDLATRLAGSADVFPPSRGPLASVNFVTAHDGFTLADLTAYDVKHNEANGENNRDGNDDNHSWNHGVEGPTSDPEVLAARRRTARNLLGTLLLATGIPMITAGDELGRTQGGNNNPYCLDDETSWIDWRLGHEQEALVETTAHLLRLRRDHPVLRQDRFFAGRPVHADGTKDLAWFGPEGSEMTHERWHDPALRTLQMYLHAVVPDGHGGHVDESLLLVVQGAGTSVDVRLPGPPWGTDYTLLWDSAVDLPPGVPGGPAVAHEEGGDAVSVPANSLRVYGANGP